MNDIPPGLHLSPDQVVDALQGLALVGGGIVLVGLGILYLLLRHVVAHEIARLKAHLTSQLPKEFVPRNEHMLHVERLERLIAAAAGTPLPEDERG